jgi:hypothetical protein
MPRKKQQDPNEVVQVSEIYAGETRIEFRPDSKRARYTITDRGELLKPNPVSVTTITNLKDRSGPLMHWAVKNAVEVCRERIRPDEIHGAQYLEQVWKDATEKYDQVKKKAADVGVQAHQALENYFNIPPEEFAPPLLSTPVRARFDEAVKWFSGHRIESVCRERPVYSRKYRYCGTLDHLAYVDGVLTLLDYKAAKNVYNTYVFQTSAYIKAYAEETGLHADEIRILQIGEEKTIPYQYKRSQIDIAFEGFLGLLSMYNSDKNLGKPEAEEVDWLAAL